MDARQICLHNRSGKDCQYALFMSVPMVWGEDVGPMYSNVFITRYVFDGMDEDIDINDQIYAWYDTRKDSLGFGSVVIGGTYLPVTMGGKTARGSTFTTTVKAKRPVLCESESKAPHGQFQPRAHRAPPRPELFGVAKKGDNGMVLPVMTMKAIPSYLYGVKPVNKYYLAQVDDVELGEIQDLRSLQHKVSIDFTARNDAMSVAVVTHYKDGRMGVEYKESSNNTSSSVLQTADNGATFGLQHHKGRWTGTMTWPDTVGAATVVQDSGTVIDALAAKYGWSAITTPTPSGGVSMRVQFWLKDASAPRQDTRVYREDWRAALASSSLQSGDGAYTDLGCFPNTPYGSVVGLSVLAR